MTPRRRAAPASRLVDGIRGTVGLALLVFPRPALRLVGEDPNSRGPQTFTAVLGARHLVQTGLTVLVPALGAAEHETEGGAKTAIAVGAGVDLVHAATMIGWAILVPRHRRAAMANAAAAFGFATAGLLAARARPPPVRAPFAARVHAAGRG